MTNGGFVSAGAMVVQKRSRLSITTKKRVSQMRALPPVTPGELLHEEFLIPMGISQYRLAREIGVPPQRISEIVAGKRAITADTDLRLCRFLGLSDGYWLRAQAAHDTEIAARKLSKILQKITPWPQSSETSPR